MPVTTVNLDGTPFKEATVRLICKLRISRKPVTFVIVGSYGSTFRQELYVIDGWLGKVSGNMLVCPRSSPVAVYWYDGFWEFDEDARLIRYTSTDRLSYRHLDGVTWSYPSLYEAPMHLELVFGSDDELICLRVADSCPLDPELRMELAWRVVERNRRLLSDSDDHRPAVDDYRAAVEEFIAGR